MNYYTEIKKELINNEIYKRVKDYSKNKNDLETYYNVGKLLVEAQGGENRAKYGDSLIKEYSKRLTNELGKCYTISALRRMRRFYIIIEKGATLSNQLTWSHYIDILKFDNINLINYYVKISINQKLSVRDLRNKIKNKYNYIEISEKVLKQLILEDISRFMEELGDGFSFIKSEYKIKLGDRYKYIDLLLYRI